MRCFSKEKVYEIIFESDSPNGKLFDVILLWIIFFSITVVMIESVPEWGITYHKPLYLLEWLFTIIFTIEFFFRLYCIEKKLSYVFSFFGIIDILSIIPTYLTLFISGGQYFIVIRVLRLLRMFRVLKMAQHTKQGYLLLNALKASRPKIVVFMFTVLSSSLILGTIMYLIEGHNENSKFSSIPKGVYWAIVTITTVGYGDMTPQTSLGQLISAATMFIGFGIIAVPTGIIGFDIYKEYESLEANEVICNKCKSKGHSKVSNYCFNCGNTL